MVRGGLVWLEQLLQDLRYGARMLRRSPGFSAVVILTFALGIGLNTAMFSVVNAVLLKPLPYPDSDRLVWVAAQDPSCCSEDFSISRADYLIWQGRAHSVSLAAYGNEDRALVYEKEASTVQIASITGDFWNISGAAPGLGRLFREDEPDSFVLSWKLFQSRFGGDPQIVGKTVTLDGHLFTITGVLPRSFRFLFPPDHRAGDYVGDIEGYIPIPAGHEVPGYPIAGSVELGPTPAWIRTVGKLKPGSSFAGVRAEMQVIFDGIQKQYPNSFSHNANNQLVFIPLTERVVGGARVALTLLFGAVGFVLLIAGSNVASLLMARASTREREIAVRSALGASRVRLIRQFLVESVLLAILGGAAGLLIARGALGLAVRLGAQAVPRLAGVRIDVPVLLFTLVVAVAAGILFGLAPGIGLRRANVGETLKREAGTSSIGVGQLRFRRWLVTLEFALAIVLLAGAGLMLKSFWLMNDYPSGFAPEKLVIAHISHAGPAYFRQWPRQEAYLQELFRRIERLPGVEAFGVECGELNVEVPGVGAHPSRKTTLAVRYVSPKYLTALGAPLVQGRWPTDAESQSLADVIVVNQSLANLMGGASTAIGRRIRGSVLDATVVGVVADVKDFQMDAPPAPEVYMPYQMTPGVLNIRLLLRASKDPRLVEAALPDLISGIDASVPIRIETLEQSLSDSIAPRRFNMSLLETFAGAAVMLALIGIYGVLAYLVKQRTREIGIRMALGAQRRQIVNMVVWEGMRIALAGMVLGIVAALGLTRLMSSMLYNIGPGDPVTFISVALILTVTALLACWPPALRAALTDPMISLRHE